MQKQSLSGAWELTDSKKAVNVTGHLPGCNFLDMMENGVIKDPFWGENEKDMMEYVERDYEYSRFFDSSSGLLANDSVDLVVSGLDTLAEVRLNGKVIANTDNVHRTYRFPVKELLKEEGNHIQIHFFSPLPYLEEKNREDNLKFNTGMGIEGISHIRKIQCHFGWDWGPVLPPAGISGSIELEGYTTARIKQTSISQEHKPESVVLHISTDILTSNNISQTLKSRNSDFAEQVEVDNERPEEASQQAEKIVSDKSEEAGFLLKTSIHYPSGIVKVVESRFSGNAGVQNIEIENPELWWCNGLGDQPLCGVAVELFDGDRLLDDKHMKIGLRTIELDTKKDSIGNNFRFLINGVPIFVKGADWIPSDSFITRTSREDLEFYMAGAKNANMNMLRVWGGGYYESDTFYDLCDRYGILVWQDFGFACLPYPFYNQDFLDNVELEVKDNVQRIKHHASLALWCGNNEIELMTMLIKINARLKEANGKFFHDTLKNWVNKEDGITPYWPGSPNSGAPFDKPNDFNRGDTHLWQVWHGMLPIEHFRKMPTRFCSEFGMESLPSMKAVRTITDKKEPDIFDSVMMAHQKSKGGNQKMLFYLLAKFRNPVRFEDFVYLSQIVQAETIREATEEWKRNIGKCNGAIYWQYNDCWPVASWAGIDYEKQYKAVIYSSKTFNQPLSASLDIRKGTADIYVVNEYPGEEKIKLHCQIEDFSGNLIWQEEKNLTMRGVQAVKALSLSLGTVLKGSGREDKVMVIRLLKGEKVIFTQNRLLVPDKEASLQKTGITKELKREGQRGVLTLKTDTYARYVYVDIPGVDTPLSDNFFDIRGNGSYTLTFDMPKGIEDTELLERISLNTLSQVPFKGNKLTDKALRLAMRLHKDNIVAWILFHFI